MPPPRLVPKSTEVGLYLAEGRKVCLEGHGCGGPPVEVTFLACRCGVLGEACRQPAGGGGAEALESVAS